MRWPLKERIQHRHQRGELLGETLAVHKIGFAGHGKKLRWRRGSVGIQPGPLAAKTLGNDDLLAKLFVRRFPGGAPGSMGGAGEKDSFLWNLSGNADGRRGIRQKYLRIE